MANILTALSGWSITEASNQPDSTDSATIAGDLRAIQAGVRYIYSQDTIASAATTDLGSKDAGSLTISGTTTITALGTVSAGIRKSCVFSGILTLTHNGTSLILPGAANITTAANDRAEFESLGSGNWRCNWYVKASGQPITSPLSDGDKGDITVSSSGAVWSIDADVIDAANLADSVLGVAMINGTLTASVAASALTIAIKTKAGTDPSATDPVLIYFRNVTAGTGDYTALSLTAATSLVISSGSTMGTTSAVASRLWVVGFNDGGTFRLGAVNLSTMIAIGDDVLGSATDEGGAGAADSAGVIYSNAAVSAKAMRVLGYVESTQATAGTWATSPSKVQMVTDIYDTNPPKSYFSAVAASGTDVDFTGIPSWITNLVVGLSGFSTNGTAIPQVVIGDAGGFEVTTYAGSVTEPGAATINFTTGFSLTNTSAAASVWHGSVHLTKQDGTNTWVAIANMGKSDSPAMRLMAGSKTLSDTLTQVRVTAGGNTLDAGTISLTGW